MRWCRVLAKRLSSALRRNCADTRVFLQSKTSRKIAHARSENIPMRMQTLQLFTKQAIKSRYVIADGEINLELKPKPTASATATDACVSCPPVDLLSAIECPPGQSYWLTIQTCESCPVPTCVMNAMITSMPTGMVKSGVAGAATRTTRHSTVTVYTSAPTAQAGSVPESHSTSAHRTLVICVTIGSLFLFLAVCLAIFLIRKRGKSTSDTRERKLRWWLSSSGGRYRSKAKDVEKHTPSPSSSKEFNESSPLGPIIPPAGESNPQILLPHVGTSPYGTGDTAKRAIVSSLGSVTEGLGHHLDQNGGPPLPPVPDADTNKKDDSRSKQFWKRTSHLFQLKNSRGAATKLAPVAPLAITKGKSTSGAPRLDIGIDKTDITVTPSDNVDPLGTETAIEPLDVGAPSTSTAPSILPANVETGRITTDLPPRIDFDASPATSLQHVGVSSDLSRIINDSVVKLYDMYWDREGGMPPVLRGSPSNAHGQSPVPRANTPRESLYAHSTRSTRGKPTDLRQAALRRERTARDGIIEYDTRSHNSSVSLGLGDENLEELIRAQKQQDSRPLSIGGVSLLEGIRISAPGPSHRARAYVSQDNLDFAKPHDVPPGENALGISLSGSHPSYEASPPAIKTGPSIDSTPGTDSKEATYETPSHYSPASRGESGSYYGSPQVHQQVMPSSSPPQITPAAEFYGRRNSGLLSRRSYLANSLPSGNSRPYTNLTCGDDFTESQNMTARADRNQQYSMIPVNLSRINEGTQPLHFGANENGTELYDPNRHHPRYL